MEQRDERGSTEPRSLQSEDYVVQDSLHSCQSFEQHENFNQHMIKEQQGSDERY
jgi:hypothetical protein